MDWPKMIDAARVENANGIEVRRGKKYTTTAIRVEMMRRFAGDLGITTEIVHWSTDKGQPVVIKATIADATGRVLATGHAEEIRGNGNVNTTSALENAETSAIGRALAALGLSGGEFASANEMDGVERKTEAQAAAGETRPEPVDLHRAAINAAATTATLKAIWASLPETHRKDAAVVTAINARLEQLKKEAA